MNKEAIVKEAFEKARMDAEVPDLWFHDLRKAFVTYQRGAGHDDRTVASLAGHRDLRVNDLYMTPTEAQRRAAIESIPAPATADKVQTNESIPSGLLTPTHQKASILVDFRPVRP